MLKYVTQTLGQPHPNPIYSNTLYLWQIRILQEERMKTGIIDSVCPYQRGVVIRGGTKWELTRKRLSSISHAF